MDEIRRTDERTEDELEQIDRERLQAAGGQYASIKPESHVITATDTNRGERIRRHVEKHYPLRFTGCSSDGNGVALSFRYDGD